MCNYNFYWQVHLANAYARIGHLILDPGEVVLEATAELPECNCNYHPPLFLLTLGHQDIMGMCMPSPITNKQISLIREEPLLSSSLGASQVDAIYSNWN